MDIIQYLLLTIQNLYSQNLWLLSFICRYIPLLQFEFDDSHSPEYQKFKTDRLPKIIPVRHEDWKHLRREWRHAHNDRELFPIRRRGDFNIPKVTIAPAVELLWNTSTETMETQSASVQGLWHSFLL